jgi:hypothetical protein
MTSSSFKAAYTCKQDNYELASTLATTRERVELQETAPRGTPGAPTTSLGTSKSAKEAKDAWTSVANATKHTRVVTSSSDK